MTTKKKAAPSRFKNPKRQPKRSKQPTEQKPKAKNPLMGYCRSVLLARDITPEYAEKVRCCCRRFCDWLGYQPDVADLNADDVNEFLQSMQETGRRPDTVLGYRRAILLLWNVAYQAGDTETPSTRIRRIRTYRDPVEAFTQDELRQLLEYVGTLYGFFPNGGKRKDLWACLIWAAYSTGLRRGDLLSVKRKLVTADGVCRVRQSKTGYPITVRFASQALEARDRMTEVVDDRMVPWPHHPNALPRQFRQVCEAAGVRAGQFRWLRRSCGSYADAEKFGNGSLVLGHRDRRMFVEHYECTDITRKEPVSPPEIKANTFKPGNAKGGRDA